MIAPKTALNRLAIAALTISLAPAAEATDQGKEAAMTEIRVIVGEKTLTATLDTTPVAQDFAALLPLDLTLSDYHGIEKVADLPRKLDTAAYRTAMSPRPVTSRFTRPGAIWRSSTSHSSARAVLCG